MDKVDDLEIDPTRLITRDAPGCPEWAKGKMQQIRVRVSDEDPKCRIPSIEGWFAVRYAKEKGCSYMIWTESGDDFSWYRYIQPVLKPAPWNPQVGEHVIAWISGDNHVNCGCLQILGEIGRAYPYKVYGAWYHHIARMRPIDEHTTPEDIMRGGDWK